jgi:phosphoribosylanthranilate isomerase
MKTVRVKICGITTKQDLKVAVNAGADALGFILEIPSSPRNITFDKAKKLIKLVPIFVESIVVIIPENIDHLKRVYEQIKPNGIQIHGEKVPEVKAIREAFPHLHIIKTIHLDCKSFESNLKSFDAILLDSIVKGKYGGTGIVQDWKLSRRVRNEIYPTCFILAGGLTPDNVKDAILTVSPYGVDVSSGVESSLGIKDPKKIKNFVKNAKMVRF